MSMSKYVGVDWASKGWLCAIREDESWSLELCPSFYSVWHRHKNAESIFVDIPIGLATESRRTCDKKAREKLGSARQSSVFWTPCRDAVYESSYERAKATNESNTGHKISSQAWGIIPRIQEVDEFICGHPEAMETVLESHPEIVFTALNNWTAVESSKQDSKGRQERLDVLAKHDSTIKGEYDRLVGKHIEQPPTFARRISTNSRDDIVDSMGLAVAAWLTGGDPNTLPKNPPMDDELPMQIAYHDPT